MHCLGRLNTGGAETLVMNVLRKIDRDKFQFDFLLYNDSPGFYDDEAKMLGSNLYYTPSMSEAGVIKYIKKMITFFKNGKIDVIHSHMDWQGGFIAYAAHKAGIKKIIVHSHANQKMFDRNFIYHHLININRFLISKYATDCLACSKEAGESLFNDKFVILINGIDFEKYQKPNKEIIERLRNEFNISDNDIVLGNVGSLSTNKNQIFLIELLHDLCEKNKNYKLILVGAGNEENRLRQCVDEFNLNNHVIFAGVRSEIPEIMSLFDMFLFPSKMEGLGIVAIEAQAANLSCIISEIVPKSVDMQLGLVSWVPLEKDKWINKILNYKNINVEKNERLAESNFDIGVTCKKLVEKYQQDLQEGGI